MKKVKMEENEEGGGLNEVRQELKEERGDLNGTRQELKEEKGDLNGVRQELKEEKQELNEVKVRGWSFTIFDYTPRDIEVLHGIICRYMFFSYVKREDRESLTGCIYFKNAKKEYTIKGMFENNNMMMEPVGVDQFHSDEYCNRDGKYFEAGVPPSDRSVRGKMTRASRLHKMREENHIAETGSVMEWYFGVSGSGKTTRVKMTYPEYYEKAYNKWWNCYNGEEIVVIENFSVRPSQEMIALLKIWCDRHPFPAMTNGGVINIRPRRIVVTSYNHPRQIFKEDMDYDVILQRFNLYHCSRGIVHQIHTALDKVDVIADVPDINFDEMASAFTHEEESSVVPEGIKKDAMLVDSLRNMPTSPLTNPLTAPLMRTTIKMIRQMDDMLLEGVI